MPPRNDSEVMMPTVTQGAFQETDARGNSRPGNANADQPGLATTSDDLQESHQLGKGHEPIAFNDGSPSIPIVQPMSSSTRTEQEIVYDIYQFILEMVDPGGVDTSICFERATAQPPITPESLAELDMSRIINNPKLRHDVNFDRELHFRPNLDGSKGRQKMKAAEEYWLALEGELFMYVFVQQQRALPYQQQDDTYWDRVTRASAKRLPKVFEVVRDILKTLVPDADQQKIVERLDVDLFMQEIRNGVCDLVDLSNWLAKVLKNHCAPMRDALVDRMQKDINRGTAARDHSLMVSGLRQLLCILEAMKLDVANHQIRHMRPLLIEDTINFQRRYNAHRISLHKIDISKPRLWLQFEIQKLTTTGYKPTYLDALSSALLRDLVFPNSESAFPATFYLDSDRLLTLRVDLHSIIYQRICADVLVSVVRSRVSQKKLAQGLEALYTSLQAIVGTQGRYTDKGANIAVEIIRIVLMLQGRRQTYDASLMEFVEQKLATQLRATSPSFISHADKLLQQLTPELQQSVQAKSRLSALELQENLVPHIPTPQIQSHTLGFGAVCQPPNPQPQQTHAETEILRRLTHLLILHWRIWAGLAYQDPPEAQDSEAAGDVDKHTPPSSEAPSPSIPAAQDIYKPEKKGLPDAVDVAEVNGRTGISTGMPMPSTTPERRLENGGRRDGEGCDFVERRVEGSEYEEGYGDGKRGGLAGRPSPG